jgi:hypothetical protein
MWYSTRLQMPNIYRALLNAVESAKPTCCGLLLAGDADVTADCQRHDISDAQHTAAAAPQIRKSNQHVMRLACCL